MAKREIVNVDEDIIKKMIAGDIPTQPFTQLSKQGQNIQAEKTELDETENVWKEEDVKEESVQKSTRRRKSRLDYKNIFFSRLRNSAQRQTTIILGEDVYSSIQKILKVAEDVTLANFINNVLRHHFLEYKEEITELRRNYMSDLFKDE